MTLSQDVLSVYIPTDRRHALALDKALPDRMHGAALFADISGFTPLAESLVRALGPHRGAEELTRHLNLVYDALIAVADRFRGSVVTFAGDAITCWFDGDSGRRATACALELQQAMVQFAHLALPCGGTVGLTLKVAVAAGTVRRFVVGDPAIQLIDVMAGVTLDRLAAAEHAAQKGEVVVCAEVVPALDDHAVVVHRVGLPYAVVEHMEMSVEAVPWPPLLSDALTDAKTRPWLLLPVAERLRSGQGEFLAELRPAVALFLRFEGIDYDSDVDAEAKLDAYIRWVQAVLTRYEGVLIELSMGDKGSYLFAAFGAPLAHADDATRAVVAALALAAVPLELAYIQNVQIGISMGRMRTGAYGGTTRRNYGIQGDHVNLAARLMQHAPAGQVLVSEGVQLSVADTCTWERLAPLTVKGKSEPVTVFRAIGVNEHRALHLQAPRYAVPLVGRQAELALIEDKLAQVLGGDGQILALAAEAGMGKSRLVAEIIRMASERGCVAYAGECQSYATYQSYLVWQTIWQNFFGLDPSQPVDDQIALVERRLADIDPALVPRAPLLGPVVNLPIPDNDLTASLDAKLRKTSLEALLVDCIRWRAQTTPLLLVLEDCHWLDPLSHDLLEAIGRAGTNLPVLVVVAYRPPELEHLQAPRVTLLPHCTVVPLSSLTRDEALHLMRLKLAQAGDGGTELSPVLVERIAERAEGNPFYIEELLNYLRDMRIDALTPEALERLALPSSLHSLILSRIDRLTDSQKITLKVASIIGRLFPFAWLWGVHPGLGAAARVKADLEVLDRLELAPLDQPEPELKYLFKHIVTREVAYESLPFATRAVLHGQLGQFIEQRYGDALEQQVDLLAHHYWHSENEPKKREYLRKAGEAAQAVFANTAAIDYYRRLLPRLAPTEQPAVLMRLGQVLELVGRWQDADECYCRALALAKEAHDRETEVHARRAIGWLLRKRGDYPEALQWLQQARSGFEALHDAASISHVLAEIGEVHRMQGHYAEAETWYAKSLELANTIMEPGVQKRARANALKGAGTIAAQQGNSARAQGLYEESLALLRELGDKPGVALLINNLGVVMRYQNDHDRARMLNAESLAVFRELGDRWAVGQLLNNHGCLAADLGDYAEARELLAESLIIRRELGDKAGLALTLNSLGDVLIDEGDFDAAVAQISESLALNTELEDVAAIAYLLDDIAALAAARGESSLALRLAGAAVSARESVGASASPAEQSRFERLLRPAWVAEGQDSGSRAWEDGRVTTLEQAIRYAAQYLEEPHALG